MSTDDLQTLLLSSNLGLAENYVPAAPLARVIAKDSFHAGRLYLRATVDEMIKIRRMSKSLGDDHRVLLRETKDQYDNLLLQEAELELFEKRNWLYKLFKPKLKRAIRVFAGDAGELLDSIWTTSSQMKRTLLSTRSTDLAPVNSESVEGESLSGLAVDMNGPLTQEAIDTLRELVSNLPSVIPPPNPTPPDSQDEQTSTTGTTLVAQPSSSARSSISTSPTSPGSASNFSSINFNVNVNIVNNTDSTAPGLTINNNGSGNRGSGILGHCSSVDGSPS